MKRLTLRIAPEEAFGRTHAALREAGTRGRLLAIHPHGDAVVELCAFEGDAATVERALREEPAVTTVEITDGGAAYVRVEPDDTVAGLLGLLSEHGLLLDTPVALGRDAVTVDVVGTQSGIHDAAEALPPAVRAVVTVEHLGEFTPAGGPLDRLTDRQREVAATAVAVGYYATPRNATVADVAGAADCSTSTASEHLRKAEAAVFAALMNGRR